MGDERRPESLSTVRQAARVLEFIAGEGEPVGLSDLATTLNLPKASMHRILRTWTSLGYLEQDSDSRYRLGWKLFELTSLHIEGSDLRTAVHPFLQDISEQTGETVHLSVLDGDDVIYVDKIEGRQAIRVYTSIGRRGPVHATASGKAMLAYQSTEYLESLFKRDSLTQFNGLTLTRSDQLEAECEKIRAQGYAVNRGEWHEEVAGVGVPLMDHNHDVGSALSVTFPSIYLTESRIGELAETLIVAGIDCSKRLGFVDLQAPSD